MKDRDREDEPEVKYEQNGAANGEDRKGERYEYNYAYWQR